MEVEMMYPEIIGYSLILAVLVLFARRKKNSFKKGVIVANTKYITKIHYYKSLMLKYRIYNAIIKILCILLILGFSIITARMFKPDEHKEEIYNRDIMLCLDVSGSVWELDTEIISTFVDIVSELKDERFGLSIFNYSPISIIPLTTDYNYAINTLKKISDGMKDKSSIKTDPYMREIFSGTEVKTGGSSLIGTGLAYCASTFRKGDDRTKIIIFATDNELAGKDIISLEEAAKYSKENNIKVYPVGTKTIKANKKIGMESVAKITGGQYYDYSSLSVKEIVKNVENLNASSITKTAYVTKKELPELVFPYILCILPLLFLLEWRVRI